jgi:CDP-6-deoxy-D-xylo-4-hexulose-3-dehydrase
MNNADSAKLAGAIELLLDSSSRINEAKPRRYWYPLSLATYGVEEIVEALDSLCSFRTTMWEKTAEFERRFSEYQNCAESVMVNSGSSADLLLCFLLTNPLKPVLKPGDEVLVPVVTWPTQIWSAMMAGLTVKLVDVCPETLNVDLDDLESKISPATRAIFVVHLMGNPCDMNRILNLCQSHGLLLLEDCCEALGSEWNGRKVGNFGIGGAFSFFFSHHITTMEGGMVTCGNVEIADQLRVLRAHGWLRNVDVTHFQHSQDELDPRYTFANWGFNVRPTDLQAGFGLRQLERLPAFNQRRQAFAGKFFSFLETSPFLKKPQIGKEGLPSWFALPIRVAESAPFSRKELTDYLEEQGIETRPIVAGNLARHPAASLFKAFGESRFPGAESVHRRSFYIGLSPLQTDSAMDRLLETFSGFLSRYSG